MHRVVGGEHPHCDGGVVVQVQLQMDLGVSLCDTVSFWSPAMPLTLRPGQDSFHASSVGFYLVQLLVPGSKKKAIHDDLMPSISESFCFPTKLQLGFRQGWGLT